MENFQMVAKTFQGLEEILADELSALGATDINIGRRMVAFKGDLKLMYAANLCCRTALRILKPLYKFEASNPDELYDAVREINWENLLTPDKTFSIDSTVNSSEFTHSKFVTYRVKDGIVDHFRDNCGQRPNVRLQGADIQLNVHILDEQVTISLDSSGEPLSRRGYRTEHTDAPINEALAAGIILLTGWRGDTPFCDPMCGSGTFLIEAALIAANINPGIFRQHFAFETWPDFDRDLFEELYNDDSGERPVAHAIYGADIDPEAVSIARRNIKSAGVENYIELTCRDFTDSPEALEPEGVLITNPPYGERLKPEKLELLYHNIGSTLKNNFKGWHAWILGYKKEHFDQIGMKASMKIPLLNGSLECQLREYVMFDGKFNAFRAQGGILNSSGKKDEPSKYDRIKRDKKEFKSHDTDRHKKKTFVREDKFTRDNRHSAFQPTERPENRKPFDKGARHDRQKPSNSGFHSSERMRGTGNYRNSSHPGKRSSTPYRVVDKGPKLSAETATVFIPANMRSRKGWRKKTNDNTESTDKQS